MTGPLRWGSMKLLVLACACSNVGCTPSGDGTAAAHTDIIDGRIVAPAEGPTAPTANVTAPVGPVAGAVPAKASRPVVAEPSLDLPASNDATDAPAFPAEVTTFMVDRDGCDHFRGEEPYDAERAAYLDQSIRDLCSGSDETLAKLRRRYAQEPDVMAALGNYEDRIEPSEGPED